MEIMPIGKVDARFFDTEKSCGIQFSWNRRAYLEGLPDVVVDTKSGLATIGRHLKKLMLSTLNFGLGIPIRSLEPYFCHT